MSSDTITVVDSKTSMKIPRGKITLTWVLLSYIFSSVTYAKKTSDRPKVDAFRVNGMEAVEPAFETFQGDMYAGLLSASWSSDRNEIDDEDDKALFFWFFEPDEPDFDDSVLIWLNGGPGCSSLLGAIFENGPVTIPHFHAGTAHTLGHAPLVPNKEAWTKATRMLFVEQPMGTGFSYGPEPEDEEELALAFYNFLQNYFEVFPDLRDKRLSIFGESYAGMYVPSIARTIYLKNKQLGEHASEYHINISGIGLGNGWIDPMIQGPAVIDYMYWHGTIDSHTKQALYSQWRACQASLTAKSTVMPELHPFTTPDECGMMDLTLYASGASPHFSGPNTYDVTTWDNYPVIYDLNGTIARFFNTQGVRDALNLPPIEDLGGMKWLECIPGSGRRRLHLLDHDKPISVVPYIAELLDHAGIKVLMYNGDRDMSCCVQGTELSLNQMQWSGSSTWRSSDLQRGLWMVQTPRGRKEPAGYSKSLNNLEFVVVYNSGHMVPANQPRNALDLLKRFLGNESFADVPLPVIPFTEEESKTFKKASYFGKNLGLVVSGWMAGVFCAVAVFAYRHTRQKDEESPEAESPNGNVEVVPEKKSLLHGINYQAGSSSISF